MTTSKVTQVQEYLKAFNSGSLGSRSVNGLLGRVIRGKNPKDFETLSDDPNRRIILLTDSLGLENIVGKDHFDILITIGWEPSYAIQKVNDGFQMKLVVLREGGPARLATWDGMMEVVYLAYPEIATKLKKWLPELKKVKFDDLEKSYGCDMSKVDREGDTNHKFMTLERYEQADDTLENARAFLYFSVHLREQYAGDGYTYDAQGNQGVKEYMAPNCNISELLDSEIVDLQVKLPSPKSNPKSKKGNRVMKNVHLLIIDPQNDFCDIGGATLPVPGAEEDMKRVASLIDRIGSKLADIHVTMDSHRLIDIAHPAWWKNQNNDQPAPFTIISVDDIENGIWVPRNPNFLKRTLEYAKQLETNGKYQLCVWPPHCLIGTWGHNVHADLNEALQRWSGNEFAMVDYVTKGSNPWTEHYGAVQAEVPDPSDPSTALNTDFLTMLSEADMVVVAGEALSHCVKETVTQIADNIGDEHVKKFHILTDCSSPVPAVPAPGPDFPAIAQAWLKEMEARGMTLTNSVDFLT
ncbi:hypothetical protein ACFL1Y_01695 [Patescibacteria group bacterium]